MLLNQMAGFGTYTAAYGSLRSKTKNINAYQFVKFTIIKTISVVFNLHNNSHNKSHKTYKIFNENVFLTSFGIRHMNTFIFVGCIRKWKCENGLFPQNLTFLFPDCVAESDECQVLLNLPLN